MNIKILYCNPCGFEKNAHRLGADIEAQFGGKVGEVQITSTEKIGAFEVYIDEELVYSKMKMGHFPLPGEIEQKIINKVFGSNG